MNDPDPDEFVDFLTLLTDDAPDGYRPWLFRVEAGSKAPALEYGSWKDESARMTRHEAVEWMQSGGNVGIAGRPDDPLINVDIDDEDATTIDDLKPTLIARSRSRTGVHAWYFEAPGADIPNIPTDDAGEVRANWQYVVAPGSYVETDPDDVHEDERDRAGYYTVERDDPVTSIRLDELPEVFREHNNPDPKEQEIITPDDEDFPDGDGSDNGEKSELFDIGAEQVASKEGGATNNNRWTAIFHGSETGKNMSVSDQGRIQCWRHNVAHNGLQALTVLSDYPGSCQDVGTPHDDSNAGRSCLHAEDGAHIWHAWKYAKQNGYVPDDDPVPYAALKHVCREREHCAVSEIPDEYDPNDEDGRLPGYAYDAALASIENHDGLNPGRDRIDDIGGDEEEPHVSVNNEAEDDEKGDEDDAHDGQDGTDEESEEGGEDDAHDDDNGRQPALGPLELKAVLGIGEDANISDLDDRQKAAGIWAIAQQRDDIHVRYREDTGTFWNFDDGIWREDGEQELAYAARQVVNPVNYGQNLLTELKEQVKATPRCVLTARDFGVEPGCLAVENGLLDLDAAGDGAGWDAIRPLEPDDYARSRLPVQYDPDAEAGEWGALVDEWAEDGKGAALQEYVGYTLHAGEKPIHRTLLLVGSGANGKSTFLHVVRQLLGDKKDPARNNVVSTELQTLANEKDALADLEGKLANIDDDLSSRSLGAGLGMFKKIAAGDPVRARRLYEDGFRFTPGAKQLYACNQVPDVDVAEDDDAFWRRWLLVEFPNWYPPNARDPDLKDRLEDSETLSGVLNWAIEGRRRLLDNGAFTGEEDYAHAKYERWTSWGDTADQFIGELERDEDGERVSTSQLYDRFKAWCEATGKDPDIGQQGLTNQAKQENFGYGRIRIDGKSQRGFKHIGFSDEVPKPEPEGVDEERDGRQDSLV